MAETQRQSVPALRFPEFDGEWVEKRVRDIAPLQRGFDLPTTKVKKGKYPVVYSNGILRYHNEYKAEGPGIVTGRSGTIGKVTFVVDAYWPHNTSLWVTDFLGNEPKFIYYFYVRIRLERLNAGSTIPTLNRNVVHSVKSKIPKLGEQRKIASFLSSVDGKIEQLGKKKTLLEQYKKGCMQKLFSQEFRFKDAHGNDFPDWEERRLGDVVRVFDGTHQTPKYVKTGVPFYSVEHVTANQFEKTKFISQEVFEKENRRVSIEKGDILMTRIGSIGVAKYVDWDVRASFYVSLALIKPTTEVIGGFLAQCVMSENFQRELWKRTIHVAFPKKINLGEIGNCHFCLPQELEQQKIADFLSSIDRKIDLVSTELDHAKTFKKGLLQQMFV